MTDRVLILDFGGQTTQLIARRVRESGVYCEILPFNVGAERIAAFKPSAIILSGGPASVTQSDTPRASRAVYRRGRARPRHLLRPADHVRRAGRQGRGLGPPRVRPRLHRHRRRLRAVEGAWKKGGREQVWMSHGDRVIALARRASARSRSATARPSPPSPTTTRRFYGVQFHPEVMHTPHGAELLRNFTHGVAGCRGDWTMAAFRERRHRQGARPGRRASASSAACRAASIPRSWRSCCTRRSASSSPASSSITACCARARPSRSSRCSATTTTSRSSTGTPPSCSSASSRASTTPSRSARSSARTFIDVFEEEAKKIGGARVPGAGHALSRRDRIGLATGRPVASPSSRTTMSAACRRA